MKNIETSHFLFKIQVLIIPKAVALEKYYQAHNTVMRGGSTETKCGCSQQKPVGKHIPSRAGSIPGCCILNAVKKQSNKTNSDQLSFTTFWFFQQNLLN